MHISDVLRESVIAIFQSEILEKNFVLKGGAALHFAEHLDSRLSTDIDFSTREPIKLPVVYSDQMTSALSAHFKGLGFFLIDAKFEHRPRDPKNVPHFWGGWEYKFKLVPLAFQKSSQHEQRKNALIPREASSSIISIDISDHEYSGSTQTIRLGETDVIVYSSALLVLEKMRAICQQHSSYPHILRKKNRGRDFYDIYSLAKKYRMSDAFVQELADHIKQVFAAKDVPLTLINEISNPAFTNPIAEGFNVAFTARGDVETFDFYLQQLRTLIQNIKKKMRDPEF